MRILFILLLFITTSAFAESAFYITPRIEFEMYGKDYIKVPAVEDEKGNIIKEAIWDVEIIKAYKPKILDIYESTVSLDATLSEEDFSGATSSKINEDYYIIKVFATEALHNAVKASLASEDGVYIGATLLESKLAINSSGSLSSKIDSSGMTDGFVRE